MRSVSVFPDWLNAIAHLKKHVLSRLRKDRFFGGAMFLKIDSPILFTSFGMAAQGKRHVQP
jgi:hypothetical protein